MVSHSGRSAHTRVLMRCAQMCVCRRRSHVRLLTIVCARHAPPRACCSPRLAASNRYDRCCVVCSRRISSRPRQHTRRAPRHAQMMTRCIPSSLPLIVCLHSLPRSLSRSRLRSLVLQSIWLADRRQSRGCTIGTGPHTIRTDESTRHDEDDLQARTRGDRRAMAHRHRLRACCCSWCVVVAARTGAKPLAADGSSEHIPT
jgi:hypothetical protein